jgi:hypothetical protein
MPEREIALLDACSLINLYATRQIEAILASHPDSFAVVDTVRRESGYVFRGGNGPGATEQEPIDLGPLEAAGLLVALTAVSEAELLTYIDLLLEMGDGEAMTGAVAIHRGLTVVTDDRKALRVADRARRHLRDIARPRQGMDRSRRHRPRRTTGDPDRHPPAGAVPAASDSSASRLVG